MPVSAVRPGAGAGSWSVCASHATLSLSLVEQLADGICSIAVTRSE